MTQEILVLGAGMVGTCTALELTLRGHAVTLLDRRPPAQETSYGNAGLIQREAVEPHPMPRDLPTLLTAALGQRLDMQYHFSGLLAAWPQLLGYFRASAPARFKDISRQYASLIAHCTSEHARYIDLAGAEELIRRDGLRFIYRGERAYEEGVKEAHRLRDTYGIGFNAIDTAALSAAEPAFRQPLGGAVHWLDTWGVRDPGMLCERYAAKFQQLGGRFVSGDAASLQQTSTGWRADSKEGPVQARQAVVALGPWADSFTRQLGYRLPLMIKRGYHRHYTGGAPLNLATLDAERGYLMAPQLRGLRITTGAELARMGAPATPRQLAGCEAAARELFDLGQPVEAQPWLGNRPCVADMKPVIGPAPRHKGLWFNFGHGHQGFTLGPASARLLSDLIEGGTPYTDATAFSPARFSQA
jgi:D-amino-acid dehydrogenase